MIITILFLSAVIATESQCLCAAMTNDKTKCPCLGLTQLASQEDNFWISNLKVDVQRDVTSMNTPNPQPSYFLISNDQIQCLYIQYLVKKTFIGSYSTSREWGCGQQPSNPLCSLTSLSSQISNAGNARQS